MTGIYLSLLYTASFDIAENIIKKSIIIMVIGFYFLC